MSTRVGYAGGELANPTYHDLGNHTEAVEVTFDPAQVSFAELLDVFWHSFPFHIPPGPSRVRTAVITRGAAQTTAAEVSKQRMALRTGDRVYTRVLPEGAFWPAERMHQKFDLQRVYPDLIRDLAGSSDDAAIDAFLVSGAAARLNAYVSGFRHPHLLAEAGRELGLTIEELERRLTPSQPDSENGGSDRGRDT